MITKLTSKRLTICTFTKYFLSENYISWLNDKEVVKYSEQRHFSHSLESCKQYYESFIGTNNLFLAILFNQEKVEHIGNITVLIDNNNKLADIAIMIGEKKYWGMGLGKEAWNTVLTKLLSQPEIRKITAGTMSINRPMLRLMEGSGMLMECNRKLHYLFDGEEVDMVYSSIFSKK